MSTCGSSADSAHTAASAVLDCESPNLLPPGPSIRSNGSRIFPDDSEEHASSTSENDDCSDNAVSPNRTDMCDSLESNCHEERLVAVYVKGDPKTCPQEPKDCLYCQRILLILEEKQIPYARHFIDPRDKPEWLFEVDPSGRLPLLQEGETFVMETERISAFIEEKYPQPALPIDEEGMAAAGGIFAAFRRYLLNKDASLDADLLERMQDELESMNQYLDLVGGPFFGGENFSSADAALLPRLHRMQVALFHFKQWQIPEIYPRVTEYMRRAKERPSFFKTACRDEEIIRSWKLHMLLDVPRRSDSNSS